MTTPYIIIQKKRDGHALSVEEIREFITGYVQGSIPDYQMAAFLMAVFFRGMTSRETAVLTEVMIRSGDSIAPEELGENTADKHSTGGVGDKISIVLAPLAAAAGLRVPMMSGRGLGHTGGTLDKLESIPGFNVRLEKDAFIRQIDRIGVAMIGQTDRIAPADKKMYALRDVTATVDCIPLIAASIMSKKIAAGPKNLILDVKVGRGAFMKDVPNALKLAQTMVDIGTSHDRNVSAMLTDMGTQPLGMTIGNSLEIEECIETLNGGGPPDIRRLTLALTTEMLLMAGVETDRVRATKHLERLLDSGKAMEKFLDMVEAQGGDATAIQQPEKLPASPLQKTITATRHGYLCGIDPMALGLAGVQIGAGRVRQTDTIDPGAGFRLHVKAGAEIYPGDALVDVYSTNLVPDALLEDIRNAFEIRETPPEPADLIIQYVPMRE